MTDILELHADNDTGIAHTFLDGAGAPVVGLVVTAYVSATKEKPTEAAIHADLTPTVTVTDGTGTTTGTLQGSAITARLCTAPPTPPYTGRLVYLIWKSGTDYFAYRTCVVRDYRVAG